MDLKKTIEDNIKKAIKEFEEREDIVTKFGEPVIGYANAADPLFNMFFSKNISEHPKGIYRQGNSLIMHFVPYAEEVTKNNANSDEPSAEWVRAYVESIWLSMKINGAIRDILDQEGIASSYLNTPADWNEETHREKMVT